MNAGGIDFTDPIWTMKNPSKCPPHTQGFSAINPPRSSSGPGGSGTMAAKSLNVGSNNYNKTRQRLNRVQVSYSPRLD